MEEVKEETDLVQDIMIYYKKHIRYIDTEKGQVEELVNYLNQLNITVSEARLYLNDFLVVKSLIHNTYSSSSLLCFFAGAATGILLGRTFISEFFQILTICITLSFVFCVIDNNKRNKQRTIREIKRLLILNAMSHPGSK